LRDHARVVPVGASGEITWFRNDVRNLIFRNLLGEEEFEEREEEFVDRFGGREPAGHEKYGAEGEGEEHQPPRKYGTSLEMGRNFKLLYNVRF
jgi:hypothetical protein